MTFTRIRGIRGDDRGNPIEPEDRCFAVSIQPCPTFRGDGRELENYRCKKSGNWKIDGTERRLCGLHKNKVKRGRSVLFFDSHEVE
jgi:hypothetical protein